MYIIRFSPLLSILYHIATLHYANRTQSQRLGAIANLCSVMQNRYSTSVMMNLADLERT